jgi:hypothetical protein
MHFATKCPNDHFGRIKGAHPQFVAPILPGLSGLAVSSMWPRVWARAGRIAALGALLLAFIYTVDCHLVGFGPSDPRESSTRFGHRNSRPAALAFRGRTVFLAEARSALSAGTAVRRRPPVTVLRAQASVNVPTLPGHPSDAAISAGATMSTVPSGANASSGSVDPRMHLPATTTLV